MNIDLAIKALTEDELILISNDHQYRAQFIDDYILVELICAGCPEPAFFSPQLFEEAFREMQWSIEPQDSTGPALKH